MNKAEELSAKLNEIDRTDEFYEEIDLEIYDDDIFR